MGTSKGYIPPTRIQWSNAKRAVTQMLKNRDASSTAKAISRFASAMKADATSTSTFSKAAAGLLGLSKAISGSGTTNALNQINRQDLIGKNSEEIWNELLHEYTNSGSTAEDALAADALSKTLDNLKIQDLEQLGQVQQDVFLLEMLINFISINFEFRYSEKIGKDRSPLEASRIVKEIQDYIRSNLYENLELSNINAVDFLDLSNSQYVDNALADAYSIFEKLYTED